MPAGYLYLDDLRTNPNARVVIDAGGATSTLTAFITHDIDFGGANSFNTPLESVMQVAKGGFQAWNEMGMASNWVNQKLGGSQATAAGRTIGGADSIVSWAASERPAITLDLIFLAARAGDNPLDAVRTMMDYVYPQNYSVGGVLTAPLGFLPFGDGTISIKIGQWFQTPPYFVCKSVSPKISQRTDPEGMPLYVQAQVSFEAFRTMAADEVKAFFLL